MVGVPFIQHGIAILALEIKMCAAKMDPFTSKLFHRDSFKGVVHFSKNLADNLLTPMSSKMAMFFFLQSKRN